MNDSTEKILIVDDDKNICEVINMYLQSTGYETKMVYDGKAAVDAFKDYKPNLVILDVMLPNMNGIDILKWIRKEGTVPVIMLTAKGETFDKVLALELGADDYIVKPFEPKEFELLYYLAKNKNKVFTREQLLCEVWGYDYPGDSRTVDVHVKRLRSKIKGGTDWSLETVWGVGYKFEVE